MSPLLRCGRAWREGWDAVEQAGGPGAPLASEGVTRIRGTGLGPRGPLGASVDSVDFGTQRAALEAPAQNARNAALTPHACPRGTPNDTRVADPASHPSRAHHRSREGVHPGTPGKPPVTPPPEPRHDGNPRPSSEGNTPRSPAS